MSVRYFPGGRRPLGGTETDRGEGPRRKDDWKAQGGPRFKAHLAWCLFKKGLHEEGAALLAEIPESERDDHIRAVARAVSARS